MRAMGLLWIFAAGCGTGELEYTPRAEGDTDTDADTDADSDSDSDVGKYEIEIGGTWVDSLGIGNAITDETWTWTYPGHPDTIFDITDFENEPGVAVVQDSVENDVGEKLWGRFDWTWSGDVPYVCHAADSVADEAAATSAPTPDRNDLISGCQGFEWWALYPT